MTACATRREAERLLLSYHEGDFQATDDEIDAMLGLAATETVGLSEALRRYGNHRLYRQDIPYACVRELFRRLSPSDRSKILDLGSGYGRIGFYGALVFGCRYTGVEIVAERVAVAEAARIRLGLDGLAFVTGDALAANWPACSCVCVMNSFLPSLTNAAVVRLREHVSRTGGTVAAISTIATLLGAQEWLVEKPSGRRALSTSPKIFLPTAAA